MLRLYNQQSKTEVDRNNIHADFQLKELIVQKRLNQMHSEGHDLT